ncbi:MAG: RAMP superfamily CRISPR-associated protein [Candidatus Omnitrophica bacterium]|nr:RAMP superfamily CRISPR-associated protein [Candidatus Omnitrophota bacterium]
MGRGNLKRDVFIGNICFDTPLHIGSGEESIQTDALFLRDTEGNLLLPGTSIAGAFLSHLKKILDNSYSGLLEEIFGREKKASKVIFEDSVLKNENSTIIRDGVGINRETLTAQDKAKYDREVVQPAFCFPFQMSVDYTFNDNQNEIRKIILLGLEEFCNGHILLGGNKTRGEGFCHLNIEKVYSLDFSNLECLIPFLKNGLNGVGILTYEDYKKDVSFTSLKLNSIIRLEINYEILLKEPFVIKGRGEFEKEEFDTSPIKILKNLNSAVSYIPGTSIKGPFRFRAEQILNTLGLDCCDPTKNGGCGKCLICNLFGFSSKEGQIGRIYFKDLYPSNKELNEKKFDFVAINRFTGGALPKAKFNAKVLTSGCFEGKIIIENPKEYEIALILQVFKDLYLSDLPIGYGKNKGFGRIQGIIKNMKFMKLGKDEIIKKYGKFKEEGVWKSYNIDLKFKGNEKGLDVDGNLKEFIKCLDKEWKNYLRSQNEDLSLCRENE